MKYGERLSKAMEYRGDSIGRKITRKEVAAVAECSVQNIGMIIADAKNKDQKLQTKAHAAVAAFLRVSSEWLLNEIGEMALSATVSAPTELTPAAIEIAALFDMIPSDDRIRHAQAYNLATTAIMQVLHTSQSKS